ncbi:helix-turn-helix domain-containing protein [Spirosoma endbachense]|uniref:Helix-turn-helix domain-containing protein n=1 Tax=Spirosoma endbachense TaxID=2666025 RepID=A0A6P1W5J6_9BACT|nr:helix-turn-helix transcriptional regulator [Spirosoma endbachense]QHV99299.1 helix-turn-helix domain-containing protein [Spirosoma endbachense]
MSISDKIKAVRKAKGITPTVMARELGIEATNYPRLENRGNRLTYENLEAISKALGITVIELLTWGEEIKEPIVRPEETKKLEKDISRIEELLDYQRDKIKYFKTVIAKFVIESAWEEFIDSTPDPIIVVENEEQAEMGWDYDREAWDSYLNTYIFGTTAFWKLFESGLLDNKVLKEVEGQPDVLIPFDVRMLQARRKKQADKLFGKVDEK